MPFDLLTVPITFTRPLYLSDASAWIEHIPFAFTLMALAKPRIFVELGTHKGDSYFAFCQAVQQLNLPTACTAVDTWTGDDHTGKYSPQLFNEVRAYHDPHYRGFSQLLQSEFDSAVEKFADGSIDLLHIDGLHTYAAVKHDYQTWLPKLSPQAVVLFHDITQTTGDFGVHQLFAELAAQHPTFNFHHGYGLGLVAVGPQPPAPVQEFLAAAQANPDSVRACYARLGESIAQLTTLIAMLRQACQTQTEINRLCRQLNRPTFPNGEQLAFALQNPGPLMRQQCQMLRDLLKPAP